MPLASGTDGAKLTESLSTKVVPVMTVPLGSRSAIALANVEASSGFEKRMTRSAPRSTPVAFCAGNESAIVSGASFVTRIASTADWLSSCVTRATIGVEPFAANGTAAVKCVSVIVA